MSKRALAGMVLLAGLLALAAGLPFAATAGARRDFYWFEAELTSDRDGQTQVFFDMGGGTNEADSSRQPLRANDRPIRYRYLLPSGTLRALRLDPIDREGTMTLAHAHILNRYGEVIRAFTPGDFRAVQQIATLETTGEVIRMTTDRGAGDPILELRVGAPVDLPVTRRMLLGTMLPPAAGAFAGGLLLALAAERLRLRDRLARLVTWGEKHPWAWLAAAAALGVAVQCHPVLFLGRSFVSPDNASYLLYDTFPTLPGYTTTELEEAKGSDVAATLLSHMFYPPVSARAVLGDGELPLWNRYNDAGLPLLGQGQTTFGELLAFVPFFWDNLTAAWDAKFLLAHWVYGLGIGLVVFRLTRHAGVAALLAATAGYVGFFAFRLNHPAQFSVCLAPWILLAWLGIADARHWRALGLALGGWILANWEVMASGTIKEAYMIQICLNLAGFLLLVLPADRPGRERLLKVAAVAAAGVVYLLLTAPAWLLFLDALKHSQTSYDAPGAMQQPWWQFIGFFEELFYRQFKPDEAVANPSANLLVFAGLAGLLLAGRKGWTDRRNLALAAACLLPVGIVFGFIPAALLVKIPFIANIHHTDNTFSCALLVLTTVLAGPGLAALLEQARARGWWWRAGAVLLLAGVLAGVWYRHTGGLAFSPFFRGYTPGLLVGLAVGLAALAMLPRPGWGGAGLACAAAALGLLLWRHGQYLQTPFDAYVVNPKVRADFRAPSAAVADVQARLTEPSRPYGIGFNLFSGYHQMFGWESIVGVDALRNGRYDALVVAGGTLKARWWDFPPESWRETDLTAQLPLQDMLNVRYYLGTHREPARELRGLRLLAQHDLDVYESPTAWPRAFFTNQVTTHANVADFVQQLRTGDRRPFASLAREDAAAFRTTEPGPAFAARLVRPAENYRLTGNSTSFRINAPGPGYAVLTETYYPEDFRVTLDGEPVEYFRVNQAFKGIRIPAAGTFEVSFTYHPRRLGPALACGALGALLLAAGLATSVLASRRHAGFLPLLAT